MKTTASKQINWHVSKRDADIIRRITTRALSFGMENFDRVTCDMDLTACHANGCPLLLEKLLNADDFNFMHDVVGIHNHINRESGQLENCFVPRFAL